MKAATPLPRLPSGCGVWRRSGCCHFPSERLSVSGSAAAVVAALAQGLGPGLAAVRGAGCAQLPSATWPSAPRRRPGGAKKTRRPRLPQGKYFLGRLGPEGQASRQTSEGRTPGAVRERKPRALSVIGGALETAQRRFPDPRAASTPPLARLVCFLPPLLPHFSQPFSI